MNINPKKSRLKDLREYKKFILKIQFISAIVFMRIKKQ